MARPGANLDVVCDQCKITTTLVELTLASSGTWDDRHVNRELEFRGWRVGKDMDICPDCAAEMPHSSKGLHDLARAAD